MNASKIVQQAAVTIAATVLAALIVGQVPELRAWLARQWNGLPHP